MQLKQKLFILLSLFLTVISISSCSTLAYYRQSISGHLQMVNQTRDIDTLLASDETPTELKQRLRRLLDIRSFASQVLLLPDNGSYRSYADIGRKYIVWNVFATPALSLQPAQSCFLFVGCLSYRGYFHREDAADYAKQLEDQGLDVYLGGVSAYSTLGWFDDPLLNGMLDRSDSELARLLFHELAHQHLYIKDDSEFNEAYADSVALIGLAIWHQEPENMTESREFNAILKRENEFTHLVLSYRAQLLQLFASELDDETKLQQKQQLYKQLRQEYQELKTSWGGVGDYDAWFANKLNNAKILAVSTYRHLLPLFRDTYEYLDRDLTEFYSRVRKISACDVDKRRELLREPAQSVQC